MSVRLWCRASLKRKEKRRRKKDAQCSQKSALPDRVRFKKECIVFAAISRFWENPITLPAGLPRRWPLFRLAALTYLSLPACRKSHIRMISVTSSLPKMTHPHGICHFEPATNDISAWYLPLSAYQNWHIRQKRHHQKEHIHVVSVNSNPPKMTHPYGMCHFEPTKNDTSVRNNIPAKNYTTKNNTSALYMPLWARQKWHIGQKRYHQKWHIYMVSANPPKIAHPCGIYRFHPPGHDFCASLEASPSLSATTIDHRRRGQSILNFQDSYSTHKLYKKYNSGGIGMQAPFNGQLGHMSPKSVTSTQVNKK